MRVREEKNGQEEVAERGGIERYQKALIVLGIVEALLIPLLVYLIFYR